MQKQSVDKLQRSRSRYCTPVTEKNRRKALFLIEAKMLGLAGFLTPFILVRFVSTRNQNGEYMLSFSSTTATPVGMDLKELALRAPFDVSSMRHHMASPIYQHCVRSSKNPSSLSDLLKRGHIFSIFCSPRRSFLLIWYKTLLSFASPRRPLAQLTWHSRTDRRRGFYFVPYVSHSTPSPYSTRSYTGSVRSCWLHVSPRDSLPVVGFRH